MIQTEDATTATATPSPSPSRSSRDIAALASERRTRIIAAGAAGLAALCGLALVRMRLRQREEESRVYRLRRFGSATWSGVSRAGVRLATPVATHPDALAGLLTRTLFEVVLLAGAMRARRRALNGTRRRRI